jgi:hypothetical protein
MEKLERGRRNLEKFKHIANPQVWHGRVTFWNPTPDDTLTRTMHGDDARLITQLYDRVKPDKQEDFLLGIATAYGFNKLLTYAYSHSEYRELRFRSP